MANVKSLPGPPKASTLVVPVVILMIMLGMCYFVFWGAQKMKRLENWNLSLAASIAAMIPCFTHCGCFIGLGVGIWSIVVLLKPEVKEAFTS